MTTNKKISIIGICAIVFFVISIALLFSTRKAIEKSNTISKAVSNDALIYQSMLLDYMENSGKKLENLIISNIESHDVIEGKKIMNSNDSILLVCRINEFDCPDCTDYAIERVIDFWEDINKSLKLEIWGYYESDNALKIIKNRHRYSDSIDYRRVLDIDLPIDIHGNPYFFVLKNDLTVSDIYTIKKNEKDANKFYFNNLWAKVVMR